MAKLILAKNQEISKYPFVFLSTGISVYTLEEAAFHLYQYWKICYNDFVSDEFYEWAKGRFGLFGYDFFQTDNKSLDYINFIELTGLFCNKEIKELEKKLKNWANTSQWIRYKENGDEAFYNKNYLKALKYYVKSTDIVDNYKVYNNIGLCYKYLDKNKLACDYFEKALELNCKDEIVLVNLVESNIIIGKLDNGLKLLRDYVNVISEDKVIYFQGKIFDYKKNYKKALEKYNLACNIKFCKEYLFSYVDLCINMRMYSEAESFVSDFDYDDVEILLKKADIFYKAGNTKKAIDTLLSNVSNDVKVITKLAMYYRLSYKLDESKKYIEMATKIDKNNLDVKMENAYILKYQGKFKEYNILINNILEEIKNNYKKMEGQNG